MMAGSSNSPNDGTMNQDGNENPEKVKKEENEEKDICGMHPTSSRRAVGKLLFI